MEKKERNGGRERKELIRGGKRQGKKEKKREKRA